MKSGDRLCTLRNGHSACKRFIFTFVCAHHLLPQKQNRSAVGWYRNLLPSSVHGPAQSPRQPAHCPLLFVLTVVQEAFHLRTNILSALKMALQQHNLSQFPYDLVLRMVKFLKSSDAALFFNVEATREKRSLEGPLIRASGNMFPFHNCPQRSIRGMHPLAGEGMLEPSAVGLHEAD